jgi:kynurenine formamidase
MTPRGPAWYWNNITAGEHTGTHFDAPNHWVTGQDRIDISAVPLVQFVAPAVVIDHSAESAADPDFLLEISHVQAWEGARSAARGWLAAVPHWLGRAR